MYKIGDKVVPIEFPLVKRPYSISKIAQNGIFDDDGDLAFSSTIYYLYQWSNRDQAFTDRTLRLASLEEVQLNKILN